MRPSVLMIALLFCQCSEPNTTSNNLNDDLLGFAGQVKTSDHKIEEESRLAASHIFIGHNKSREPRATFQRTPEEALKLAKELHSNIIENGKFEENAIKYSECARSRFSGGNLGLFDKGWMPENFEKRLLELSVGEISEPVETPSGFHIIRRNVSTPLEVRHILISHVGALYRTAEETRNRDDAQKMAKEVRMRLLEGHTSFDELVKSFSDCRTSKKKGGVLKPFYFGEMEKEFEIVAYRLKQGEISDVFETSYGFHIVQKI